MGLGLISKCHGQTRMYGVRDENGLPMICPRFQELADQATEQRRLDFHRRGGLDLIMAVAGLGMGTMSDSKKDAMGGHQPKPLGYEWIGRRSTHIYEQPGRYSKKRASKLNRQRSKSEIESDSEANLGAKGGE